MTAGVELSRAEFLLLVERARSYGHESPHFVADDFRPVVERIIAGRMADVLREAADSAHHHMVDVPRWLRLRADALTDEVPSSLQDRMAAIRRETGGEHGGAR